MSIQHVKYSPLLELGEALDQDPTVHLENLQRVARRILGDQVLDLRAGECDVPLAEEGRDVLAGDLRERVLSVLQLPEPLGRQAKLRLRRWSTSIGSGSRATAVGVGLGAAGVIEVWAKGAVTLGA